jgi:hypothetical protein
MPRQTRAFLRRAAGSLPILVALLLAGSASADANSAVRQCAVPSSARHIGVTRLSTDAPCGVASYLATDSELPRVVLRLDDRRWVGQLSRSVGTKYVYASQGARPALKVTIVFRQS